MHIVEKTLNYLDDEKLFTFSEEFSNGILLKANLLFDNDKFIDYQKDLIQDFLADLVEQSRTDNYDLDEVKTNFELGLQNLNTKLKLFADKVRDVDFFSIKGYVQIVANNVLITSMIGDVTLLIFRDEKLYYSLHNGLNTQGKIDVFSDFVEGDTEIEDEILYIGTKVSDALDDTDIRELEQVLQSEEESVFAVIKDLLATRIEDSKVGFIVHYVIDGLGLKSRYTTIASKRNEKKGLNPKWKKNILANKYYITIIFLGIIILFMLYHVLGQLLNKTETEVFVNSEWVVVDVTIEDIKKDIYKFKSMDSTSSEKGRKYYEILQQLDILDQKGRRLEDVAQLRKIIQADYYEGFNIIYIPKLDKLDDPATNTKTRVLTFNNTEKKRLGNFHSLVWGRNLMIAGDDWALIGAINDNMRGSLIEYGDEGIVIGCNKNLLGDGIYCYTKNGNLFNVTKENGIEPVITSSIGWFPDTIAWVHVYGKSNIYLFQPDLQSLWSGVLLTRYRNTLGSQVQFQEGQNYNVGGGREWINLGSGKFSEFAIDSTFLVWSNGKMHQFRRDEPSAPLLSVRVVPLMGGDTMTSQYSNQVKIISSIESKYVFLFDKVNKNFTIYESRPLKTNDAFTSQYNLYYLFRFAFDLEENEVIDVIIPEETGNRPEMYILSTDGINKVNLYDFIDDFKASWDIEGVS